MIIADLATHTVAFGTGGTNSGCKHTGLPQPDMLILDS